MTSKKGFQPIWFPPFQTASNLTWRERWFSITLRQACLICREGCAAKSHATDSIGMLCGLTFPRLFCSFYSEHRARSWYGKIYFITPTRSTVGTSYCHDYNGSLAPQFLRKHNGDEYNSCIRYEILIVCVLSYCIGESVLNVFVFSRC